MVFWQILRRVKVQSFSFRVRMIPFRQSEARNIGQDVDMKSRIRAVVVKQLPERLNESDGRLFFNELESCMNVDRPSIVFDCSKMSQMDRTAILLLLCCLEEAIKRNGDVKLAAISTEARAMLKLTEADRLFEIFDTAAEAVISFRPLSSTSVASAFAPGTSLRTATNSA